MKLKCSNKPVISCKELSTPENTAVLEDPPTSTNEDQSPLLLHQHCYTKSSGAALVSDTKNLQFSTFWILQFRRAVGVPGTRVQHITHSQLSQCQWQPMIMSVSRNRIKFSVEHLFLVTLTHLGRSVHCNKRHEAQGVFQPQSHYMLINWNNLNNRWLQSTRDTYSYSLKIGIIAHISIISILGKTSATLPPLSKPPCLRKSHYIHPQPTEQIQ